MTEVISTTISRELYDKAREHHIKWSEALRVGIGVMLADLGDPSYTGNLNIYRKVRNMAEILDRTSKELDALRGDQN